MDTLDALGNADGHARLPRQTSQRSSAIISRRWRRIGESHLHIEKAGRRIFGGIPILGMPFKSGRPATRLLLKNVCLTHMDGTENHSLNDLLPHASATSNNAATRTDTNQVLRGSSRGGQCHGGSKAKGLL